MSMFPNGQEKHEDTPQLGNYRGSEDTTTSSTQITVSALSNILAQIPGDTVISIEIMNPENEKQVIPAIIVGVGQDASGEIVLLGYPGTYEQWTGE